MEQKLNPHPQYFITGHGRSAMSRGSLGVAGVMGSGCQWGWGEEHWLGMTNVNLEGMKRMKLILLERDPDTSSLLEKSFIPATS